MTYKGELMITVSIPKDLRETFKDIKLTPNVWIAGGAIRDTLAGLNYSDIDVFGTDAESIENFCKSNDLTDNLILHKTNMAILYAKDKILIHVVIGYFFTSIEDSLKSFDMTVCMFAYDGVNLYVQDSEYQKHLSDRVIKIVNYKTPLTTLARALRLMRTRYWYLSKTEIDNICKYIIEQPDLVALCDVFYHKNLELMNETH